MFHTRRNISENYPQFGLAPSKSNAEQDRQCTFNLTLRRVDVTTVTVIKQQVPNVTVRL